MNAIVIDIETEKDFKEVGGKQNMHLLGVTVVGAYEYSANAFIAFEKEEFPRLESMFEASSILIGFNIKHFDIPVLQPHVKFDLGRLDVLDLMDEVERGLGFRVSLDNLSRATLGVGKTGMGLEAIDWWRDGQKDKVKDYCLQDVRLTRDLYEFGKEHGYVLADTRDRGRVKIEVRWRDTAPAIKRILADALARRVAIMVDYKVEDGSRVLPSRRKIDIYSIGVNSFEGYCHTRGGIRTFHIERVTAATPTSELYQLQNDVQQSLI
ncbi:MAG: ribonuclease H-like domain-containing protein [Patescibacteria group bacterium]